jgi:Tol biopolymer transport system component
MTRTISATILLAAALAAPTAAQRPGLARREPVAQDIEPRYTRLYSSDTADVWAPDLSPDGRWVVFNGPADGLNAANLWIVATGGGEPVRLTSGHFFDMWARWFPSSDRLAFLSSRPAAPGSRDMYLMTIAIDPRTGQPSGPPRRVTLEPVHGMPAISPDGEHIAYRGRADSIYRIAVVPATGGVTREVASFPVEAGSVSGVPFVQWSSDGRWLYYKLRQRGSVRQVVMRVRADGGTPEELAVTSPGTVHVDPTGTLLLRIMSEAYVVGSLMRYEVRTINGDAIGRFTAHRGMYIWRFTGARSLVAQQSNAVAPIRVVPVAGGPIRQLTDAREYDWPLGWAPDGARVLILTRQDDHTVLLDAPRAGGPAREWPLPDRARHTVLARDGQHVWYTLATRDPETDRLFVATLGAREGTELSAEYFVPDQTLGRPAGPGGTDNGDELLFFKRRQGRLELWSTPPEGPARFLRSFQLGLLIKTGFAVHGTRIAYIERHGDSTALMVAEGQNGVARAIVTMPRTISDPVWSHDGRWIAAHYSTGGDSSRYAVLLLAFNEGGTSAAPPRIVSTTSAWGENIEWLPDDHALTVYGGMDDGHSAVWLVSLNSNEQPVAVTRDESAGFWGYMLSPDGRYVAYPAELPRGSSLWRLDLPDLTAASRRASR